MNMKKIAAAAAFASIASLAQAVPITGLVNTGAGLSAGDTDANYALAISGSTAGMLGTGPAGYVSTDVHPYWLAPGASSASQWLTPLAAGQQSLDPATDGTYTWTLNFSLDQYFSSANLAGRFAFDNSGAVYLNNVLLASGVDGFASWVDFSADTSLFAANNVLKFVVVNTAQNMGNPTGLRVEITSSNVPEPESLALLLGSLGILGAVSRRRQAK